MTLIRERRKKTEFIAGNKYRQTNKNQSILIR